MRLRKFFRDYFGEGRQKIEHFKGFYFLEDDERLTDYSCSPESLRNRGFRLDYGKCEPESAAKRFVAIHIKKYFSVWTGMSLRRFFSGTINVRLREYEAFPSEIPIMTEQEEEGPDFETIPPLPGREYLFYMCGLSRLRRLGVIKIKKINGEDMLFPTDRLMSDIKSGIKELEEWEEKHNKNIIP